jgi:hypothetical protein
MFKPISTEMFKPISTEAAVDLFTRVSDFRERSSGQSSIEESAALLSLFPKVRIRDDFLLDFSQDKTETGVLLPIRPFVRPIADDTWLPLFDSEPEREDLVEQLYQYFDYEKTPAGLFEYAFFCIELWSLRPSREAVDWLESTPIFAETGFDQALSAAANVSDLQRPHYFGPLAMLGEGGGGVRFLVHTPMGWDRIHYLESLVFSDGYVEQEAGQIVADMGSGLIF